MNASLHRPYGKTSPHLFLAGLTVLAVIVQGYHPYAEDGGVYLAGVKRLLNPALYPHDTAFVLEHIRFSLFAPAMAALTRVLPIGLPAILLLVYLASTWLLLYAGWQIASRCIASGWGRVGSVVLLAIWCGLPVAGTSLMITDPYVTARSITTPLSLLAVAMALDLVKPDRCGRAFVSCLAWLGIAACLHPLMAAYATGFIVLLCCAQSKHAMLRRWGPASLGALALAVAALLQAKSPPDSAAYTAVALTRYYWFPGEWHAYEQFGLIAPLLVIAGIVWRRPSSPEARALGRAAISFGVIAIVVALLFARANAATHIVARLQPLRCFQMVYLIMLLLLGGIAGDRWLRRRPLWAIPVLAVLVATMFFAQRQSYPSSNHLEFPWSTPRNPWVQAFLWVRANTPADALFAIDANYITTTGEDAQCFRAIAERSVLPDYSKDGGEASITPSLTAAWTIGSKVQAGLSTQTDVERRSRLLPLGVSWAVLKQSASTNFACPYRNDTVKVCRID